MNRLIPLTSLLALCLSSPLVAQPARPMEPAPVKINGSLQATPPPSDAIVLFDGSNLDAWERTADNGTARWELDGSGAMTVRRGMGTIKTKQAFGDYQLHLEWRPSDNIEGEGQSRGNSGVFLHSLFEVQVLDSWENPTYINGQAGSIYLQSPPLANVNKRPGEWNSYDIIFHAPRWQAGRLIEAATVTVLHNGVVIQDDFALLGATYTPQPEYNAQCEPYSQEGRMQDCSGDMPITLQDHGQVVSFRNIWLRELD